MIINSRGRHVPQLRGLTGQGSAGGRNKRVNPMVLTMPGKDDCRPHSAAQQCCIESWQSTATAQRGSEFRRCCGSRIERTEVGPIRTDTRRLMWEHSYYPEYIRISRITLPEIRCPLLLTG